jgi:FemAB-related protein (PEP-CTERM system-associated)
MSTQATTGNTIDTNNPGLSISIEVLTAEKSAQWDAFVEGCSNATFFHLAGWEQVIERSFGHRAYYLYAESEGEILGVLPLVHIKSRLFGNALMSTPFCVYGGVASENADVISQLEVAACKLAEELQVDYLEFRNREARHPDWPTKELYVTFRKTMAADAEANMLAIPRKQRAMVRKGIKAGLSGNIDNSIDAFYSAYAQSFHSLGTPVFSRKYFESLQQVFGNKCDILTIKHNGELVSSVMSFYFRDEVLPYFGGGTPIARQLKGNDFMYWELMRRSCERGLKVFDYGRSKQGTGSYSFKKNWGFEPTPLYYEYYLVKATEMPDVSPMNPKYRLFINAWKRLPLAVTKVIGPLLARNLG